MNYLQVGEGGYRWDMLLPHDPPTPLPPQEDQSGWWNWVVKLTPGPLRRRLGWEGAGEDAQSEGGVAEPGRMGSMGENSGPRM